VNFRLLSYNIGQGGAGREEALAEVIAVCEPDLVIFQEATRADVITRLAAACGMAECGTRPNTSLGFMSRQKTEHHAWHRPRMSRHAFIEVHPRGVDLRVFGVHLSAVHAAWTERRRVIELRNLLGGIERHERGLHVLVGDFNTLAPGELLDVRKLPHRLRALVWMSGGRIRWRTIELILNSGYADGFRRLHPEDPGLTFPVWDPHVRLDYVFAPADQAGRLVSCEVVRRPPAPAASDHFPLLAEIGASGVRPAAADAGL
jgi:endonuclease/exonuclease/phosphatase family metal-dependent hydrolase